MSRLMNIGFGTGNAIEDHPQRAACLGSVDQRPQQTQQDLRRSRRPHEISAARRGLQRLGRAFFQERQPAHQGGPRGGALVQPTPDCRLRLLAGSCAPGRFPQAHHRGHREPAEESSADRSTCWLGRAHAPVHIAQERSCGRTGPAAEPRTRVGVCWLVGFRTRQRGAETQAGRRASRPPVEGVGSRFQVTRSEMTFWVAMVLCRCWPSQLPHNVGFSQSCNNLYLRGLPVCVSERVFRGATCAQTYTHGRLPPLSLCGSGVCRHPCSLPMCATFVGIVSPVTSPVLAGLLSIPPFLPQELGRFCTTQRRSKAGPCNGDRSPQVQLACSCI